ncbi:MAG: DUF1289 domain-containing protein [Planctomycetales bacterium]|nr:DUF1289 domain-containing protein [Planctomycetales bacterium]
MIGDSQLCVGCFRTLGEIARWSSMSPDQRRKTNDQCHLRRSRLPKAEGDQ